MDLSQAWSCEGNGAVWVRQRFRQYGPSVAVCSKCTKKSTATGETTASNTYKDNVTCYTTISCKCHFCVVLPKYVLETITHTPLSRVDKAHHICFLFLASSLISQPLGTLGLWPQSLDLSQCEQLWRQVIQGFKVILSYTATSKPAQAT